MGNDCWNSMTITCEKYPDGLTNFFENEIEYNNNSKYNENVCSKENYTNYVKVIRRGKYGIMVDIYTKWQPDFEWLHNLLDKYPNCWIKNEWKEEGGMAGVWIGYMEDNKKEINDMFWKDLSLEQRIIFFEEE